jgi:hypothetical protein
MGDGWWAVAGPKGQKVTKQLYLVTIEQFCGQKYVMAMYLMFKWWFMTGKENTK